MSSNVFENNNPMRDNKVVPLSTQNFFARNLRCTIVSSVVFVIAAALAFGLGFGLSNRTTSSSTDTSTIQYASPVVAYLNMPALGCAGYTVNTGGVTSSAASALLSASSTSNTSISLSGCLNTGGLMNMRMLQTTPGLAACNGSAGTAATNITSLVAFTLICVDTTGSCGSTMVSNLQTNLYASSSAAVNTLNKTFILLTNCTGGSFSAAAAIVGVPAVQALPVITLASPSLTGSASATPSSSATLSSTVSPSSSASRSALPVSPSSSASSSASPVSSASSSASPVSSASRSALPVSPSSSASSSASPVSPSSSASSSASPVSSASSSASPVSSASSSASPVSSASSSASPSTFASVTVSTTPSATH